MKRNTKIYCQTTILFDLEWYVCLCTKWRPTNGNQIAIENEETKRNWHAIHNFIRLHSL